MSQKHPHRFRYSCACLFICTFFQATAQKLDSLRFSQLFDSLRFYNTTGQNDEAFQLAQSLYQQTMTDIGENTYQAACVGQALGNAYLGQSQFEEAEPLLLKSIQVMKAVNGKDAVDLVNAYNSLGTLYSNSGRPQKGIPYMTEGIRILGLSYPAGDPAYGATYNNLGVAYDMSGDSDKALDMYSMSLQAKLKSDKPQPLKISNSYNNIGAVYELRFELDKAIENYYTSLNILADNNLQNTQEYALGLMNLGVAWTKAKNFETGKKYLLAAKNKADEVFNETHFQKGVILLNICVNFLEMEDHKSGVPLAFQALHIFRENFGEGSYFDKPCLIALASYHRQWGNIDSSLIYAQSALETGENNLGETHQETIAALNNVGATLDKMGNDEEAINIFKSAVERHERKFSENSQPVLPSLDYFDAQVSLASMHFKVFQKKKSAEVLATFKQELAKSFAIFNEMWQNSTEALTRQTLLANQYNLMELAIQSALATDDDLAAFQFSEMVKSHQLLSTVIDQKAKTMSGISPAQLEKEASLKTLINALEKQIAGSIDNLDFSNLAEPRHQLDSLRLVLSDLVKDIEENNQDYFQLKYNRSTASLAYVQDTLLSPNQTLLEYFVGDSSIFIFTVAKDKYDVVEVKKDFPLEDWVKQLQSGIFGFHSRPRSEQTDALNRKCMQQYIEFGQKLYDKLLAPVKSKLTNDLVIIPDGMLGLVPFEALLMEKPQQVANFGTYPFFIKNRNISYCYSATLLKEMKEKRHQQEPTQSLIAFAPFFEGSYEKAESSVDIRLDTLSNGQDTFSLEEVVNRKIFVVLKHSGEEVATAAKLWKGDYFLNSDATEQRFYDVAGDYRIVHLSTHGIADPRVGDYSYLAFAEQKDSIENEFLYVRDLYNTRLKADLVVLSACETAQGELQRGEGIISLARAFAYSGAKSIVTTLWTVDDSASKDLTKEFYIQLRKGKTKDAALQSAKMKLVNGKDAKRQHPFFWAGFIGVGDMSAVK